MIFRWRRFFARGACLVLALGAGCSERTPNNTSATGPGPQAEALYGQPAGAPSPTMARVRPGGSRDDSWTNAPFWCLQTELSPATLYHSATKYLGFFTQMADDGLGAPSYAAFSTRHGPRSFKNGEAMEPDGMEENWVLVWFNGAHGWTHWDSPWAVFLQHRPAGMRLDEGGLHFTFNGPAGDVALMPLYGYYKPPLTTNEFLPAHGLPGKKISTWQWAKALPREPLMRVRYWAAVTREFPVYCEDSFSVDRSQDSVTIRHLFEWRSVADDWNTKPLKLAPVSPPLALASKDKQFPVQFSKSPMDYDYCTPYGPYLGVEGADTFDATFRVLQYVNETEAFAPPDTNAHPAVRAALDKLRTAARWKYQSPGHDERDHGGPSNFCRAIQGDGWYAKALPYYDDQTRARALAGLRRFFHDGVLVTNRFVRREFPHGSGREFLVLESPGSGSSNALGDADTLNANLLETLWAYAHFTGDWELVKERWPLVRQLFCLPAATRWAGFGRDALAATGDAAAPCAAFARLAYQAGDMDSYNYGCYMFARELVHHHLKQRGADYFRKHQPWHSMEFMDEEVFLTQLWGGTAGWQLDGPKYPAKAEERQFDHRWVRFKDFDVARFYRDHYRDELRRELNWLQNRWEPKRKWENDPHLLPSLVQLRSLLLNETPARLAAVAAPDNFTGPPSGQIASCLAVLRMSRPTRYERLIPGGGPSPFVAGLEREGAGPSVNLVQSVQHEVKDKQAGTSRNLWPQATWWGWQTPTGARWNFGRVRPVREGPPGAVRVTTLNWNAQVVSYALDGAHGE